MVRHSMTLAHMTGITVLLGLAVGTSATSCEREPLIVELPYDPPSQLPLRVDFAATPPGVTLVAATVFPDSGRWYTGNVVVADDAVAYRSVNYQTFFDGELHFVDAERLEPLPSPTLTGPFPDVFTSSDVLQATSDGLYAGRNEHGVYYRWPVAGGRPPEATYHSELLGQIRGRSLLLPGDTLYTYDLASPERTDLVRINLATGVEEVVASHPTIDSDWPSELSGFTYVAPGGGRHRLMTYFVRSYSNALRTPVFRLCAYDLDADTLMYDRSIEELGPLVAPEDQSTSVNTGTVHGHLVAYQTGAQYLGFNPYAGEVLWSHSEIAGVRIFANGGEYEATPAGIMLMASNGGAPTCGLDVATGEVLWINPEITPNGPSAFAHGRDHIVYLDVNGVLMLVEAVTGRVVWECRSPLRRGTQDPQPVSAFAGLDYFAYRDGEVFIHDNAAVYRYVLDE